MPAHLAVVALAVVLLAQLEATRIGPWTTISSSCLRPIPVIPSRGKGCSVPPFVDIAEFGNNFYSCGVLKARPTSRGLHIRIKLENLPKPNLVMTAWLIWRFPTDPSNPAIFDIASHASPLAASSSGFSSGRGWEPNVFKNKGTKARLSVWLDFNPTFPNEGPLTRKVHHFQRNVPGIQQTDLRQYEIPGSGGQYAPTSSSFLRRYSPQTGFELLDTSGRPVLVRSPVQALAIAVVSHVDRTTHGISPGTLGVDHYELMSFRLAVPIGRPTRSK